MLANPEAEKEVRQLLKPLRGEGSGGLVDEILIASIFYDGGRPKLFCGTKNIRISGC
jgi:hypothetical protein